MPSNVTHRFVSPILWKLIQPLYSSAIPHVFAAAVVYTHRSVPPIPALPTLPVGQRATASCSHLFPNSTASSAAIQKTKRNTSVLFQFEKLCPDGVLHAAGHCISSCFRIGQLRNCPVLFPRPVERNRSICRCFPTTIRTTTARRTAVRWTASLSHRLIPKPGNKDDPDTAYTNKPKGFKL